MSRTAMSRKDFMRGAGAAGVGSCLCVVGLREALAAAGADVSPGAATPERAVKRMEFADGWIRRFMATLDGTLDTETCRKVMMANGKSCYCEWIAGKGVPPAVEFEQWAERVRDRLPIGGYLSVEGRTILFEYESSAETGAASPAGVCLCPMVESRPDDLSPTYCLCSVGYVKEMYERKFGRPCEVELLDSVLRGGPRCRFRITVA